MAAESLRPTIDKGQHQTLSACRLHGRVGVYQEIYHMTDTDKEMAYRIRTLVAQGKDRDDAYRIAAQELRAVKSARSEHFRNETIQRERSRPKITPDYGLKSRVGKVEPGKDRFNNRPLTKNPLLVKSERQIPESRVLALIGGK